MFVNINALHELELSYIFVYSGNADKKIDILFLKRFCWRNWYQYRFCQLSVKTMPIITFEWLFISVNMEYLKDGLYSLFEMWKQKDQKQMQQTITWENEHLWVHNAILYHSIYTSLQQLCYPKISKWPVLCLFKYEAMKYPDAKNSFTS